LVILYIKKKIYQYSKKNSTKKNRKKKREGKKRQKKKKKKKMTCMITNNMAFYLFLVIQSIFRDRNVNILLCFYFLHLAG